jgi:hypothetical protein
MQRNRTLWNLAMLALLSVWTVHGCDQATNTDAPNDISSRTQTVDLDDPYGGYNTADEQPAFGDASLAADYGPDGETAVYDNVDLTRTDNRHPRRFLMITWGNLRADSLIGFSTDWSGSLCAENAVIRVLRTIRFEEPRDHLVPRTSRECVEWVSHTQPRFDGILVSLHGMRCDSLPTVSARPDTLCEEPLSVTFKTGPLTVTFSKDELVNLHKVIPVDDAGNAVAFNTLVLAPAACPEGFLSGEWKDVEGERYAGRFRGKWVSENGLHQGYLRGVYGENSRGHHVFFGKWISESGAFKGLLAGRYGFLPNVRVTETEAEGWFAGVWFSRGLRIQGDLKGVWGKGEGEGEGGYFRGAWAARCRH